MRAYTRCGITCVEINIVGQTQSFLKRGNLLEIGHIAKWDNDWALLNRPKQSLWVDIKNVFSSELRGVLNGRPLKPVQERWW